MNHRGFAVMEFAVVAALIVVAMVFVAPYFITARQTEREAQVKSNIHAIQICLERYAVDNGGAYPTFLIGAERDSNIIRCSIDLAGNGVSSFPVAGETPFCKIGNPSDRIGLPEGIGFTVDPLIQYGYMSEYPVNPFARRDSGNWNSSNASVTSVGLAGCFPYGGLHGEKMFDLGFGWGDTPQTDFFLYTMENIEERDAERSNGQIVLDPDLDAPGNFYYHPIFNDLIPVYFHYAAAYEEWATNGTTDLTKMGIFSRETAGYYLYGYGARADRGSLEEYGLDYFNRMPVRTELPKESKIPGYIPEGVLDTSAGAADQQRCETTGYPSGEYDPWTAAFPNGVDPNGPGTVDRERMSGPDGIPDWVIIEVNSGVSVKSQTVRDQQ